MTEADHFFAGALALMSLSLLFKKAPPPTVESRRAFYLSGAATGILLGGTALFLWRFDGRSLKTFGLHDWLGNATTLSAAAAIAWVLLLLAALLLVKRGALRSWLRSVYIRYQQLMPRTRRDLVGSWVTSLAAGSGEEIVYRGFLLWYGTQLAGLPASVIGTSLLFGIAHGYQSRFGVIFATTVGLALAGVYLLSGSLFLVMWMHATYNMASFTSGRLVLSEVRTSRLSPEAA